MSYVNISARRRKNTHAYSFLLVSTMKPQAPHRALESLHISWWTRNKKEKCLKHVTSSTLVKCISIIVSVVMLSYPAITFFLWYVTSEHWTTYRTDNIKHNPKNLLTNLFTSRVCSESTLILSPHYSCENCRSGHWSPLQWTGLVAEEELDWLSGLSGFLCHQWC